MNEPRESDNTRLPPIRILDLMVLTTTIAFVFVIQENQSRAQVTPEVPPMLEYGSRLLHAIQSGITLAAIYWLIQQLRITGKFFQQPGHWIFAGFIISNLGSLLVFLFLNPGVEFAGNDKVAKLFRGFAFVQFMGSALLFVAMFRIVGRWRWALGIIACGELITSLSYAGTALMIASDGFSSGGSPIEIFFGFVTFLRFLSTVTLLLVLAIVVAADLKQRQSRDWLHWAAVIVVLMQSLVNPILDWWTTYYMNLNI